MASIDDHLYRVFRGNASVEDLSKILKYFLSGYLNDILKEEGEIQLKRNLAWNTYLNLEEGILSIYRKNKLGCFPTIGIVIAGNNDFLYNLVYSQELSEKLLKGEAELYIEENDEGYEVMIFIPTIYGIKNIISGPYKLMDMLNTKALLKINDPKYYIKFEKYILDYEKKVPMRVYTRYCKKSNQYHLDDILFLTDYISWKSFYLEDNNNQVIIANYDGIKKLKEEFGTVNVYDIVNEYGSIILSSVLLRGKPEFVVVKDINKNGIEIYTGNRENKIINKEKFCYNPLAGLYGKNYC